MSLRALVLTKDAAEYEICVNGFRFRLHGFKRRIGKTTEGSAPVFLRRRPAHPHFRQPYVARNCRIITMGVVYLKIGAIYSLP